MYCLTDISEEFGDHAKACVQEIILRRKVRHPNIIEMIDCYFHNDVVWTVFEPFEMSRALVTIIDQAAWKISEEIAVISEKLPKAWSTFIIKKSSTETKERCCPCQYSRGDILRTFCMKYLHDKSKSQRRIDCMDRQRSVPPQFLFTARSHYTAGDWVAVASAPAPSFSVLVRYGTSDLYPTQVTE
ncbi:hypothetical protein BU17DRAFT_67070 [Hysterangium stoloniferum]|nr:hypothetical protein BU17DRAFT_67070 [Hysterangium stoloniferum]